MNSEFGNPKSKFKKRFSKFKNVRSNFKKVNFKFGKANSKPGKRDFVFGKKKFTLKIHFGVRSLPESSTHLLIGLRSIREEHGTGNCVSGSCRRGRTLKHSEGQNVIL